MPPKPQKLSATSILTAGVPDFFPVGPFRTRSGALAQLLPQLGEEGAKPIPLQDPSAALNNFTVVSGSLSLSLAVSLSLGTIFKGTIAANEKAFFLDAMTYTDEYAEKALTGGGVYATRWGIGIRIYLRVQDFSGNATLNFGLVGAAVELNQASAQYEISGVGIGAEGLVAVLEELPAVGDFKYETFLKINGSILKKLATHIKDNKASLKPLPIAVAVARALDPSVTSRSYYFAIRKIADRKSVAEALAAAPATIDRDILRNAYATVAGVSNESERPSKDAEQRAEDWLRT
jgi:hypothetical protein